MMHPTQPTPRDREQRIAELRHQLRYTAPQEREQVRTELEFWMRLR